MPFSVGPGSHLTPIRRGEQVYTFERRVYVPGEKLGDPGHFETIIARITKNQEDVFVVGQEGKIFVRSVSDREAWEPWRRIEDRNFPDGFRVPPQPIAAVKRDAHQEDIFVTGGDGAIYTNWVIDHDWWNNFIQINDDNFPDRFRVAPGSPVTAIKRDAHQEDIFVVGGDGGVYTNWVVDHDPWNLWIRIDAGFRVPERSPVTAVKRDDDQQDIFVVDRDGAICTNWVVGHGSWNQWIRLDDDHFHDRFRIAPGSTVTAIKRDAHQEDILVVGGDGGVYTNWVVDHGPWNQWIRIDDDNFPQGFRVPSQPIAAVKRDQHLMDVFVVGGDGGVYTNWVVDHGPWNQWIRIEDETAPGGFRVQAGSPVTGVKRDNDLEDIFVVGPEGFVFTNWVIAYDPWNRWIPLF